MTIRLSLTQCKQLNTNGYCLREFIAEIASQPEFIRSMQPIDSIADLQAIQQGGCASGAYMPAVTYHTALECMAEHYEEIENILADHFTGGLNFDPATETWPTFASRLVAAAVECWVNQFNLDGVSWD